MDKVKSCPLAKANPKYESPSFEDWWPCDKQLCAWWSEDAQKCAMLVIAESQRKAVKGE